LGARSRTLPMKTDDLNYKNGSPQSTDENSSWLKSLGLIKKYWFWEFDANSIYTFCSPAVFEMLGYFPEEILGKTLFDLMDSEAKAKLITSLGQIINCRKPIIRLENSTIHKNGNIVLIETNGAPFYNSEGEFMGYRGINEDITKYDQTEKALTESQSRLEHATKLANLGIWEFDSVRNGFILDDWFYSLIGSSVKEEGSFMPIEDFRIKFIHPDDRDSSIEMISKARLLGVQSLSLEHRIVNTDGMLRYILARFVFQKDENGNSRLKYGVNQDITSIKRAEIELMELNAAKDKFFSILAHDLRSPLSSFVGLTDALFEDFSTMEKGEAMDIIKSMKISATNIYRLLENLLEWSKMMRNRLDFAPGKFNLKNRIIASTDILSENAGKKKIEMKINIPDDIEVFVDSHMFDGIIRNLVSNAIKFTPVGGRITLTTDFGNDQFIKISISDSGIGIPPEMKSNLFILNENTNRAGTEGEPSTGLGLLLCKEFVEKHGGKIWVESEVDNGSTFYFTIPLSDKTIG
jgi:PAS domain S-box-containing protein